MQLSEMAKRQQKYVALKDREVMERWIFRDPSKDIKTVRRKDEQVIKQLEQAQRRQQQIKAFCELVELMYLARVA
jgi:hypothetical protein